MPNFKKTILLLGDIVVFYLSLWLTLLIRYGTNFDFQRWQQHFWPLTIIYLLWLIVFYIAGLYELTLARNNIGFYSTLSRGLAINAGLAIAFFYFLFRHYSENKFIPEFNYSDFTILRLAANL
jgi:FlaA1/EpsC-like NDP-sugar epimerase